MPSASIFRTTADRSAGGGLTVEVMLKVEVGMKVPHRRAPPAVQAVHAVRFYSRGPHLSLLSPQSPKVLHCVPPPMASTPKHELSMRIYLPSLQLARKISCTFLGR